MRSSCSFVSRESRHRIVWVIALALGGSSVPAATAQMTGTPSESASASLERKLLMIEAADASPRVMPETVQVTEIELESYVLFGMRDQLPVRVDAVDLEIRPGALIASIDMFVDSDLASAQPLVGPLFEGTHTVYFEGAFQASDGVGRFDLEGVRVDGIPVPVFLVKALLSGLEEPFDLDAPFETPIGIDDVRLLSRLVSVTY